jgi:hypothetical protein
MPYAIGTRSYVAERHDDQEMAYEGLLDVDFQVNFDRVFDAPKAHECASEESFATGSTATSGTLAPDPAPDPEPIHWRMTHRGLADRTMHPEPPPIRLLLK